MLSGSVRPASWTSKHPSLSLSKSLLFGCPSPSISEFPASSSVSKIPSLSSSKSTLSSKPSSSKSGKTVRIASLEGKSAAQTNVGVITFTLYLYPFMLFVTALIFKVFVVTPEYGARFAKSVQAALPTFTCHW